MTYLKSYSRTVRSPGIPCGPVMYLPALLAARLLGQPRAFALAAIFISFDPRLLANIHILPYHQTLQVNYMNYSPKTLSRWQQPHELFGRALVDLLLPQGVTFR